MSGDYSEFGKIAIIPDAVLFRSGIRHTAKMWNFSGIDRGW